MDPTVCHVTVTTGVPGHVISIPGNVGVHQNGTVIRVKRMWTNVTWFNVTITPFAQIHQAPIAVSVLMDIRLKMVNVNRYQFQVTIFNTYSVSTLYQYLKVTSCLS